MNITILGCGYVGKALALSLKNSVYDVTVTTRHKENLFSLAPFADQVAIHNSENDSLIKLLQNQEAVVICLAADSREAYRKTYLQTAEALSLALPSLPLLSQIIYTGSTSVYGDSDGEIVFENHSLSYDKHLRSARDILIATEQTLLALASPTCQVCLFRLGEIYGPDRSIVQRVKNLKEKKLPGTGKTITNLIHLDDIVGAIQFGLNHSLNGLFNLCNDTHLCRDDFYNKICQSHQLPQVCWDPSQTSFHSGNKSVSNQKLKAEGYHFLYPEFIFD